MGVFENARARYGAWFVTAVIVFILLTQAILGLQTRRIAWPFVPYGMYSPARFDGQRLDHATHVYAVLEDGTRVTIDPKKIGLKGWMFRNNIEKGIRSGNAASLAPAIQWACVQSDQNVVRMEYEDVGVAISRNGPVYGLEPIVLGSVDVSCP